MYEISENLFKIQEKVDKIFRKILAKTVTKNGAKSLQKKWLQMFAEARAKKMAKLIKKDQQFLAYFERKFILYYLRSRASKQTDPYCKINPK